MLGLGLVGGEEGKEGTYVPATVFGALEQNLSRGLKGDVDEVLSGDNGMAKLW